mmetsp:Transcript_33754/g.74762  ORF Transcript_33754/g.74762 Transcript_33754/m.74762 type:complete len:199 (-) Transcript_33754:149-745(-)
MISWSWPLPYGISGVCLLLRPQRSFSRLGTAALALHHSLFLFMLTMSEAGGHWAVLRHDTMRAGQVAALALILHDAVPHAAEPERVLSNMGWMHIKVRNRLTSEKAGMLSASKLHLDNVKQCASIAAGNTGSGKPPRSTTVTARNSTTTPPPATPQTSTPALRKAAHQPAPPAQRRSVPLPPQLLPRRRRRRTTTQVR